MNIISLTNGLKIVTQHVPGTGFFVAHLRGLAGSNYESSDEVAAAHANEHVAMAQYSHTLTDKGANVVGVTERDYVLYMVKALKSDLQEVLDYLGNIFYSNNIKARELDINKNIISSEVKRILDNPEKLISRKGTYDLMFSSNRFKKLNTGELEDIQKLTPAKIKQFKDKNYVPTKFCLSIFGGFDEDALANNIESIFNESVTHTNYASELEFNVKSEFTFDNIHKDGLYKNYIRIDFPAFKLKDTYHMGADILAKYLHIILNTKLKQKTGNYILNVNNTSRHNYGIFEIFAEVSPDNTANMLYTLSNILAEIRESTDKGVFEHAKTRVITQMIFDFEKLSAKADYYSRVMLEGKYTSFEDWINQYKDIDVISFHRISHTILNENPKMRAIGKVNNDDLAIFKLK